ncbi:MAG: CBS domain-containing protein [Planctomycetota bacterium]
MDPLTSLKSEPISRLGPLTLNILAPTNSVLDAVRLMQDTRFGCVVVCSGETPVGVLTERDILRRMGTSQPLETPLGEVMSTSIWPLTAKDTVGKALELMKEKQCRHIVIVESSGTPVGILSARKIIRAFVEHFPSSVYNLPPVANQVHRDREGA